MSLFLVGLGISNLLELLWLQSHILKLLMLIISPPEQPYTPDESWMDDETDTSQMDQIKQLLQSNTLYNIKSGSFNIITGYRYESSESLRSVINIVILQI